MTQLILKGKNDGSLSLKSTSRLSKVNSTLPRKSSTASIQRTAPRPFQENKNSLNVKKKTNFIPRHQMQSRLVSTPNEDQTLGAPQMHELKLKAAFIFKCVLQGKLAQNFNQIIERLKPRDPQPNKYVSIATDYGAQLRAQLIARTIIT